MIEIQTRLQDILKDISTLNNIMADNTILPSFSGFTSANTNSPLHKDIKREKVTMIHSEENVYIFKIEYFTNFIEYSPDLNFQSTKANLLYKRGVNEYENKVKEEFDQVSEVTTI
jgi:hypothetical protein